MSLNLTEYTFSCHAPEAIQNFSVGFLCFQETENTEYAFGRYVDAGIQNPLCSFLLFSGNLED